jgi:hypothetical protein
MPSRMLPVGGAQRGHRRASRAAGERAHTKRPQRGEAQHQRVRLGAGSNAHRADVERVARLRGGLRRGVSATSGLSGGRGAGRRSTSLWKRAVFRSTLAAIALRFITEIMARYDISAPELPAAVAAACCCREVPAPRGLSAGDGTRVPSRRSPYQGDKRPNPKMGVFRIAGYVALLAVAAAFIKLRLPSRRFSVDDMPNLSGKVRCTGRLRPRARPHSLCAGGDRHRRERRHRLRIRSGSRGKGRPRHPGGKEARASFGAVCRLPGCRGTALRSDRWSAATRR